LKYFNTVYKKFIVATAQRLLTEEKRFITPVI